MYKCEACGAAFDEPLKVRDTDWESPVYFLECPFCNSGEIIEAKPCPCCGDPIPKFDLMCKGCEQKLRDDFRFFLHGLSAEQKELLDMMLEGTSIYDFE